MPVSYFKGNAKSQPHRVYLQRAVGSRPGHLTVMGWADNGEINMVVGVICDLLQRGTGNQDVHPTRTILFQGPNSSTPSCLLEVRLWFGSASTKCIRLSLLLDGPREFSGWNDHTFPLWNTLCHEK